MESPESSAIGEWIRYFVSGIIGGALMLVGIMRAWGTISRKAEDALALGKSSHDRHNTSDGRLGALERHEAASTVRLDALIDGHERMERKIDRLVERLGG